VRCNNEYAFYTRKSCQPSAVVLRNFNPDLWPFEPKISSQITSAQWNVYTNFGYSTTPFILRHWSAYGTDRQTERRARHDRQYCGLLGRPDNSYCLCLVIIAILRCQFAWNTTAVFGSSHGNKLYPRGWN